MSKALSLFLGVAIISTSVTRLVFLISNAAHPSNLRPIAGDFLEQDQRAKPGGKEAIAKFHFLNAGQSTIKVIDLRTSCGCTTAALAKDQYAPGEVEDIEARFEFGTHTGRQEKVIAVTTSESLDHPTFLRLILDIPRAVVLQPEFVFWKVGEP